MFIVPLIVVAVEAVPTVIVAPDASDAPIMISPVVWELPITIFPDHL